MKYSIAALTAVVGAVAAQPTLLNSNYDVVDGQPFELTFEGCESGCTISLKNGDPGNLQQVEVLGSDITGDSFTVDLGDRAADDYAFEIVANDDPENPNYSEPFPYGTGEPVESSASSVAESTTVVTSTSVSVVTSTSESSESSETTEASETTSTTELETTTITSAVSTETQDSTTITHSTTATETAAPTGSDVPDSGAERLASPLALVACAIAAMAYLN
jgi:hypothetical protein